MSEVIKAVNQIGESFEAFKRTNDQKTAEILDRIEAVEAGRDRPKAGNARGSAAAKALDAFVKTGERAGLQAPDQKDMSIVGGASVGGAMVPEEIAGQIISRALASSRLVEAVRQTNTMTADYTRILNLRGATAAWSDELGARSGTATPSLREIKPTHGELYAYPTFSRWLMQDSMFSVTDFLLENVSGQFSKSLEHSVLFGDGSNKPTGILNTAPVASADGASPERGQDTIQFVQETTSPRDLADDIINLYFTLKPEYRANAQFVMSSATLAAVRRLRDKNGGGFLWQANLSEAIDAPDGTLLGKKVLISEYMPSLGMSPESEAILCGDFQAGYELIRVHGMVLIRDDVTVPGKVKLYISQRFGGRLTDNDAIKALLK